LKIVGEYGLRNKREVWRVQLTLSKIRRAARWVLPEHSNHATAILTIVCSQLLTLDEKDPKRLFEGNALIRRLVRVGVLDESRMKLDYVLALKVEDFLERRLQTCVYKLGLAKSIHHARVLIRQRHIRYVIKRRPVDVQSLTILAVSASKLSMSHHSSFVSTPKSTSISPLAHRSVVDVLVVSGGRRPRLLRLRRRVAPRKRKRSRRISLANMVMSNWVNRSLHDRQRRY